MIRCPKCGQVDGVTRSGLVRGKQRYACKPCAYAFTLRTDPPAVPEKRRAVTIVDIAEQLGVSKSTVSRALRGHGDIHPGTKKAILELAGQLDYQTNPLAYGLVKSRSNLVGILVPEFYHVFFPTVIIGAQEVLSRAGYNVMICQSNESYETEVANVKALLASRVEGMLVSLTAQTNNFDHFRVLERKGVPVVFFNRICPELDTARVVVDDYEGAFRAVEHLIAQGYRRIAHLAGPPTLLISRQRRQGYLDALRQHGLPIDESLLIAYDLTPEKARIYARYLLDLPQPPDAIFAINDPTAIEILLVAREKGISIPQQLGLVGFSNDPVSALTEPGLTTVAQPMHELGRVAAQLFLDALTAPEGYQPPTRVLSTDLIVRRSSLRQA